MNHRECIVGRALMLLLAVACDGRQVPAQEDSATSQLVVPPTDINPAANSAAVIAAARALMEADENAALATVDEAGQPRIRTVRAFLVPLDSTDPRAGLTVWVMTRAATRKVAQIKRQPRVTLYFNDDAKITYLTIMGSAVVHTDPTEPKVKPFLGQGYEEYFWPDFPRGFIMLEIQPSWIEFLNPQLPGLKDRWTPQAVVIPPI